MQGESLNWLDGRPPGRGPRSPTRAAPDIRAEERSPMTRDLVEDIFIPAGHAVSFTVQRDQIFRLLQVEVKQVADVVFLNANDHKETIHAGNPHYLHCTERVG